MLDSRLPELLAERPADGVALLRFNRPQARNAMTMAMRLELARLLRAGADDPDVRCLVLTGDDKGFGGGGDLGELAAMSAVDRMLADRERDRLWAAWRDFPKPIVAAVRGLALGGGCELALAADLAIAGEGARFGQTEIRVGIMPGSGGTQRLTRAAGKYRAMRYLLTGDLFAASDALAMGLVAEVVADDAALPRALDLARRVAMLDPLAVRLFKQQIGLIDASASAAEAFNRALQAVLVAAAAPRRTPAG